MAAAAPAAAVPPGKPRTKRQRLEDNEKLETGTTDAVVAVYKDFQTLGNQGFKHTSSINPFLLHFGAWNDRTRRRFLGLTALKPELAAGLMYSATFREHIAGADNDEFWRVFADKLEWENKSLLAFIALRKLDFVSKYNVERDTWLARAPHILSTLRPLVPAEVIAPPEDAEHPHEVFRAKDGTLKLAYFTPKHDRRHPIKIDNIDEVEFNTEYFKDEPKPKHWPRAWGYPVPPQNPQHTSRYPYTGPFPKCANCGRPTGVQQRAPIAPPANQRLVFPDQCPCKTSKVFENTIVEVFQRDLGTGVLTATHGVRSLAKIAEDDFIGEYVGELVPLEKGEDPPWGDDSPGFQLNVPFQHTVGDRWVEPSYGLGTIISGKKGNWTRFIQRADRAAKQIPNVVFYQEPLAGKMRITVTARRDIEFGEELLA